ncbi:DNA-binding response OmpR family regulator [Winogradskyella eximia]|jgi:two-component system, OmpR family, alkaline phosphatase synthesis response regulator PhoP|uniref:DNA-binding response OmpR family regulator n=1 Tax=Winogradskyella eximia TaxID=262006 RepID=A0A3D9H107_9FLAO|nr:response regulator transcription factor [Winogradskyella eximia]RED43198.1 DNA-binding response OmpR family regulator [Winogradskyella eximia]|tara:strand:+ start:63 stop:746 length:684 start_codon:yes stop_codon:yes gene_type:complete
MANKIKLLLAEDEAALGQIIKESLETRDFEVTLCENGEVALKKYESESPEILVLDVMMPKKDGFTLAKEIRAIDETIPIIFLTAKSQTADVVEGFSIGGNDYLKKPFSMEELIVRVHNLVDRTKTQKASETIMIGAFSFDFPKQQLKYKNEDGTPLTHREAHLLFHLIKNKNQVLDRSLILNKLWGTDDFFSARSMDVFITKLRKKLKKDDSIQIINVRGFGYKLTD